MRSSLVVLLLAVELGGGFGAAEAEVLESGEDSALVEIEVRVEASADSVVAHVGVGDETESTFPLIDRGGGVFGVTTELAAVNQVVVFELIGGESARSRPVTLAEMGADLEAGRQAAGEADPGEDGRERTRRLGWLAAAAAAASLSALAFWALGGSDGAADPDA